MVDNPEDTPQTRLEIEAVTRMFDAWSRIVDEKGQQFPEKDRPLEGTFLFGSTIKNQRFANYEAERVLVEKHAQPPVSDPNFQQKPNEEWIIIEITPDNPYSTLVGRHTNTVGTKKTVDYYAQALIVGISNQGRSFQSHDWREIVTGATTTPEDLYPYFKRQPSPKTEVYLPEEPEQQIETIEPIAGTALEKLVYLSTVVNTGQAHENMFQP